MKRLSLTFIVAVLLFAFGCGTIVHGGTQQLPVSSNPPGATVRVTCNDGTTLEATTPATISLRRNADGCSVSVARSGYQTETIALRRGKSPAMIGNVGTSIVSGFGGLVVGALLCAVAENHSLYGSSSTVDTCAAVGTVVGLLLPGWLDARTGAMYAQHPERIDVVMRPAPAP